MNELARTERAVRGDPGGEALRRIIGGDDEPARTLRDCEGAEAIRDAPVDDDAIVVAGLPYMVTINPCRSESRLDTDPGSTHTIISVDSKGDLSMLLLVQTRATKGSILPGRKVKQR